MEEKNWFFIHWSSSWCDVNGKIVQHFSFISNRSLSIKSLTWHLVKRLTRDTTNERNLIFSTEKRLLLTGSTWASGIFTSLPWFTCFTLETWRFTCCAFNIFICSIPPDQLFQPDRYETHWNLFQICRPIYIYIFFHDGSFRVVSRVIFFQNVCIFARIEVWEIFIAVMTAVYLLIEMHQAFWEVSYVLIRLAIL